MEWTNACDMRSPTAYQGCHKLPELPCGRSGCRRARLGVDRKPPPTLLRRVHLGERGRLTIAWEGEQSTEIYGQRRRLHSTQSPRASCTGGRKPGEERFSGTYYQHRDRKHLWSIWREKAESGK